MSALIMDGSAVKQKILDRVKQEADSLDSKPGLAVILVGDDPASQIYVRNKVRACEEIGFNSKQVLLPASTPIDQLLSTLDQLNTDPAIHGILCQFPLPESLKKFEVDVISRIAPVKDVDGLHPLSPHTPCTPKGIMELLAEYNVSIPGKQAVVLGRSLMVGQPVAQLLLHADATVTIAHSHSINIPELVRTADILVAAIGLPEFVKGDWIKPGAVVIDVGINRTDRSLVGDVDYAAASKNAAYITPVPGGVGPMTIAMLMTNVLAAYRLLNNRSPLP